MDVAANHNMTTALLHHDPRAGLQVKFSMAILLLQRKAGLGQFSVKIVQRADGQARMRKINFDLDPEVESAGFDKMTSILKITAKDGSVITGRAAFGNGSPANPMTFDESAAKFRRCAEHADWPQDKTEKIIAFVKTLETAADSSALSPLLSANVG